jgi:putative DNA primase/helicase
MKILRMESGGFHLKGESSMGKSSIIAASGSPWGGGGPLGFAQSYLTTRNALDVIAAAHSDCFLALDETQLGGENRREAAATILHAAYRLSAGEEKARQTDQAARLTWRLTFLGSSEHSLDELARHAGESVSLGQRVRIVDIAADAGRGMGVWEELHGLATTPARFSDLVRERAHEIYGCPADAYLTHFVEWIGRDADELEAWLKARMEVCLRALGADRASGARARVARRFALVYAAGRLAAKFGILPWARKEMLQAVKDCYDRVILPPDALREATADREADAEAHAAEVAARIRRWIADDARFAATVGADFDPGRVDDYEVIHDRDRGEAVALVPRERLVEPAGGEQVLSAALEYVKQKGWLVPNQETGAVTRQKRFTGTNRKPRFVYFRAAFLGAAARKAR